MLINLITAVVGLSELLLDQQTPSHLVIVCIEPGTLVKSEILAEMFTAMQVFQTAKFTTLDL